MHSLECGSPPHKKIHLLLNPVVSDHTQMPSPAPRVCPVLQICSPCCCLNQDVPPSPGPSLPPLQLLGHQALGFSCTLGWGSPACGLRLVVRGQVCLETLKTSASPSLKWEPRRHSREVGEAWRLLDLGLTCVKMG